MNREWPIHNRLKQVRQRLGISQQRLAGAVGVTRQAIGAIEAGQFSPSVHVALRIARTLGCRVEDLFWLEPAGPAISAHWPAQGSAEPGARVTLARVGSRWMAYPLSGDEAFRLEMIPADGRVLADDQGGESAAARRVVVEPFDTLQSLERTVVLSGCTPALSLWARAAERWQPSLRVHWTFANSRHALLALARGEVHGAGTHLYDPITGEHNLPYVRRILPDAHVVLVNLGLWEEGLVVAPGNPRGLRGAADLAREDVTIVNREEGAGSRLVLELALQEAGIPPEAVKGFDTVVQSHLAVARRVASGAADAGVSTAAVAALYRLDFVPLRQVRYDLAFRKDTLSSEPVAQLLETLQHPKVRTQLQQLAGYDTQRTGEIVGETHVAPGPFPGVHQRGEGMPW